SDVCSSDLGCDPCPALFRPRSPAVGVQDTDHSRVHLVDEWSHLSTSACPARSKHPDSRTYMIESSALLPFSDSILQTVSHATPPRRSHPPTQARSRCSVSARAREPPGTNVSHQSYSSASPPSSLRAPADYRAPVRQFPRTANPPPMCKPSTKANSRFWSLSTHRSSR